MVKSLIFTTFPSEDDLLVRVARQKEATIAWRGEAFSSFQTKRDKLVRLSLR